jgi:PAS domain S-box-containing protein
LERQIAARKQAEDALQRANIELEERVQVRTAELAKANDTLRYEREMLRITLASIGDAVIATDIEGRVTFLNSVAQNLTGWSEQDSKNQPLESVFRIINEHTRKTVENPALRALREGIIVGLANHTILIAKDGTERAIDDSAAPIRDQKGDLAGAVLVFRDVTEQRRAERSARFLASIVGSSDDAIIGKDVNGVITSWNQGAERIFGYSSAEAIGRPIAMLSPPDMADEMPGILARIRRGERVDHFDAVRRAKDGRLVPISLTVSPIRDEDGEIIGASKIARDISERKRAEEALREEKSWLRATMIGIGDAVIATDAESRVTMMNPVAQALTGWQEEATGRPLEEVFCIVNEQTCQPVENPVNRVLREGTVVGLANHTALVSKDGAVRPIEDSAAPIRGEHGRIIGVVLVFRDASERRKAEAVAQRYQEILQLHNERLRILWEAASVLLTTTEPDAMLRELFGRIGPHLSLDAYFNYMVNETGDALRLVSYIGISEETARRITRLEYGEGVSGTVALHRQPIVADYIQQSDDLRAQLAKSFGIRLYVCNPLQVNDDLLGTLSFASRSRDQLNEDELAFLQTICNYVAVAYERLRLIGRLQDADRRKDEFLATLAHELRNPLAPIRNAVQILHMKGQAHPELQESRDIIDRQVRQMTRLVDDLLDVSRISRGKIDLQKQRTLLSPILTNAVEASRPLVEANKHELTLTLPPEPIYVEADTARLAQVFSNLLNNAAKFTEQGGRIWLSAQRQGSDVVVTVKDNGTGIPADKLPTLFRMFSQGEGSLGRSQGGLGIGLHLVKRLVEMHGGSVTARSEGPGKGSEFVVRVPVMIEAAGASHPTKEDEGAVPKSSLRILIVDDNRDSADSLAMMLRITGNDIRTAYDGEEAVAAAGEFRPDVVLLDIGLPKLNGYEACQRIRQQPWNKGMLLIAMTGWGQEEDRRRSQEAGFDKHMVKPVDPQVLITLLGELDGVKTS